MTITNVKHACAAVLVDDSLEEEKLELKVEKIDDDVDMKEKSEADKLVEAYRNSVSGSITGFYEKSYE